MQTREEIATLLSHSQVFHGLTGEALLDLAQASDLRMLKPSDTLIVTGLPVPGLAVVLSGAFQITRKGQVVADRLGRGNFFGEIALFGQTLGATADVIATHDSTALVIHASILSTWFKKHPDGERVFYRNLASELARKLYSTTEQAFET